MKKAISNILTGFWWPGRKTTTSNSENPPQINKNEDSRNSEPQSPSQLETEQKLSKIECDLSETKINNDDEFFLGQMNFDCDQISRIGKDMSESSKKLLNEELKMLS